MSAVSLSEHGVGIVGIATLPAYRRPQAVPERDGAALYEGLGFRALEETQVWVPQGR